MGLGKGAGVGVWIWVKGDVAHIEPADTCMVALDSCVRSAPQCCDHNAMFNEAIDTCMNISLWDIEPCGM